MNLIGDLLVDNIEDIFKYFAIDYKKTRRMYYGPCPIHEGSGETNPWNFYYEGMAYRGNWKCRTHQCEHIFKKTPVGLVRGLLSKADFGWKHEGDNMAPFKDVLDWVAKFLKRDLSTIKIEKPQIEKRNFINATRWQQIKQEENSLYIARADYRNLPMLSFPSAYFERRGYSREILELYDVADCHSIGKEMSGRAVIPVYDDSHKYVIGCAGRLMTNEKTKYKWLYNKGFRADQCLFNWWFAKDEIDKQRSVVLVESAGNCMRLKEAEVDNVLGIFGTSLGDDQINKLFTKEIYTINLLMDQGEPGRIATNTIKERLETVFNINIIKIPEQFTDDVGAMSIDDIWKYIVPQIKMHSTL